MTARRDVLERIAEALERMARPVSEPVDWLSSPAYLFDGERTQPVSEINALPLDRLRGIDDQKAATCANIARLASGAASHDMLLWGSRGMGKSALVRSAIKAQQDKDARAIALVQITSRALAKIPALLEVLSDQPRSFLLFVDDLGFSAQGELDSLALRSFLDGGIVARASSIRLAVTSNRRAIIRRDGEEGAAIHERDERDNALALADRFGLTLGFHPCDRATYLEIVDGYTSPLGLTFEDEEALAWAIARGNRSGRTAFQFACEIAGRAGLSL